MTFSEQLWLALVQASSTALLVTVLGSVAMTSWTARRERGRADFETRTRLLDDIARVGQGTYVFMQHTRRQVLRASGESAKQEALKALDQRFLDFSIEAAQIQTLLGARFGVARAVPPADRTELPPFLRWHQVHDLLALYYYNLKEDFPGIVLAETARGHGGNYHSGLDLGAYADKNSLDGERLRRMRVDIRTAYDEAMIDLARGIMTSSIAGL
ncbi:hypothetical protein [Streptomyces chartreusis]|uniref:hypothetical protein n=1 Tax=Streptomyces chartreusis TaxID=1969 RepID=UPI0037AFFF58